jgi:hypothetical protein
MTGSKVKTPGDLFRIAADGIPGADVEFVGREYLVTLGEDVAIFRYLDGSGTTWRASASEWDDGRAFFPIAMGDHIYEETS